MNAKQKIFVGCVAAFILCLAVVGKHFLADLDTGAIVALCVGTLTGLGVTHLNGDAPAAPPAVPAAPPSQAGFASIRLLTMIIGLALGLSMLAGCAGFQQALTGYEGAALKGIQASNDNTIAVWKVAACGTPLSAALRNPDIIPALKALCLPGGNASNPADLLGAGKTPITINLTVPAAAASAPK